MLYKPETKEEAKRNKYGDRSSNPGGTAYDEACCAHAVWGGYLGMYERQCSRKPGHGPEGLYCRQHAKKFNG